MEQSVTEMPRRTEGGAPVFSRVAIVGLGLIGGSIALAARKLWPGTTVIAVDQPSVLQTAVKMHAIDVAADGYGALADADLVVLAAPVRQNLLLLPQIAPHVAPGAVVTDAGSTKREIVEAAAALKPRFTFVGGHPLGGAAVSGLEHARADLFRDRAWLFTPDASTGGALERLTAFVTAFGARPRAVGAEEHDRLMAFVSHVPQLAASALMDVVGAAVGESGLSAAGRGLMDTTRLAGSRAEIWRDITSTNADQIAQALDLLIDRLQDLRNDLPAGERLTEVFERAARWRERLVAAAKRDA